MAQYRKARQDGWYTKKSFPHFDLPLSFDDAKSKVTDPAYVAAKPFWPFIGFVDRKRRFKKNKETIIIKTKDRPLRYCSHHDGYIHSYYAMHLAAKYEAKIVEMNIADGVVGYRQNIGTNVDMAKAAFDEIRRRKDCVVIAFDIEGFFESIDHRVLKSNLQTVLGVDRLAPDWFKVFRSMTQYSWVEIESLAERVDFELAKPPRPLCSAGDFRVKIRGDGGAFSKILNTNLKGYGIPQGSPISAVLSNIYMMEFDRACARFVESLGAFYKRYSDDIILVCRPGQQKLIVDFVTQEISKLGPSMKISAEKTEISEFKGAADGGLICDRPVTYLGLTFDGNHTRLRHRTVSRYYRRMSYAARHTAKAAARAGSRKVFMRKLYRELTHLGKQNFYSYAKRAKVILGENTPVRQLRRHVFILKRKVKNLGR